MRCMTPLVVAVFLVGGATAALAQSKSVDQCAQQCAAMEGAAKVACVSQCTSELELNEGQQCVDARDWLEANCVAGGFAFDYSADPSSCDADCSACEAASEHVHAGNVALCEGECGMIRSDDCVLHRSAPQ